MIPSLKWFVQGHTFSHDTRILPLKHYDLIIDADWLEHHISTCIHWKKKLMRFPHLGRRIQLKGIRDVVQPCTPVRAHKLKGLLKKKALVQCLQVQAIHLSSEPLSIHSLSEVSTDQPEMPPQIRAVVQKFQHLF